MTLDSSLGSRSRVDALEEPLLVSPVVMMPPPFGEAERLLLDEAKARVEFELKSAATLHSKSTLFLTLTGVFAAFLTSSLGRLLDRPGRSSLEVIALGVFVISLGVLIVAAVLLARSAFSRSYEIPALPGRWVEHLAGLKQRYGSEKESEAHALAHLRYDLLDGWLEAAEECARRNEAKSIVLQRVATILIIAVPASFVGLMFVLLSVLRRQ